MPYVPKSEWVVSSLKIINSPLILHLNPLKLSFRVRSYGFAYNCSNYIGRTIQILILDLQIAMQEENDAIGDGIVFAHRFKDVEFLGKL